MTSQPWTKTITMYILPDIARSKGNQEMKFGQLHDFFSKIIHKMWWRN